MQKISIRLHSDHEDPSRVQELVNWIEEDRIEGLKVQSLKDTPKQGEMGLDMSNVIELAMETPLVMAAAKGLFVSIKYYLTNYRKDEVEVIGEDGRVIKIDRRQLGNESKLIESLIEIITES